MEKSGTKVQARQSKIRWLFTHQYEIKDVLLCKSYRENNHIWTYQQNVYTSNENAILNWLQLFSGWWCIKSPYNCTHPILSWYNKHVPWRRLRISSFCYYYLVRHMVTAAWAIMELIHQLQFKLHATFVLYFYVQLWFLISCKRYLHKIFSMIHNISQLK